VIQREGEKCTRLLLDSQIVDRVFVFVTEELDRIVHVPSWGLDLL
jgi:hypothetical protein